MSDESNPKEGLVSQIHPPVFLGSAALILALVIFAVSAPEFAGDVFADVQNWIVDTFGWFYLLAVTAFLIFAFGLAVSSHGQIKLGPDHSEPDYSYTSWFAMLFSAGMGIGLLFFGVAEPVMHFTEPPVGNGGTVDAAREAMSITLFHWGLHAWAIYAVIGLSLAYFGFRHNLPLTIRSALYPLIGERIYGPIGDAVDIFAVLGTMFGVATSLGLGVMQVNAGLNYLLGVPEATGVQLALIAGITLAATVSVVAGLNAGIKRLSELNLILAGILLGFVLLVGPTLYLMQTLVQNVGAYLSSIVDLSFKLYAYEPTDWIGGWTLFYWGWWMAWSPFVGMFIARVSRGRTIREFVLGVMFVPVGFTAMWMTFFGNTAIAMELGAQAGIISNAVAENVPVALFTLLHELPLANITSGVATLLVITFFVTSSDSGSLVIDMITSGGNEDPPVWQRIFWAVSEGVVAAVLLLAGGLAGLQTAAIAGALPFSFVMILVCYGLLRGLQMEGLKRHAHGVPPPLLGGGDGVPWQRMLRNIVSHSRRDQVKRFLDSTANEALSDVARELDHHGVHAEVSRTEESVGLTVFHDEETDFVYAVELRSFRAPRFTIPAAQQNGGASDRYFRAEVHLAEGSQGYDVMGYTKEQLINDVLTQYDKHMQFLHLAR
ncbi:MAG: BCCT family transporter [Gammaproteobacteria bacterium]|jgi:choline/glycine/proline betaine transport protein|nr:BCCT family transporter [Gammaproteobacteria bacterium]